MVSIYKSEEGERLVQERYRQLLAARSLILMKRGDKQRRARSKVRSEPTQKGEPALPADDVHVSAPTDQHAVVTAQSFGHRARRGMHHAIGQPVLDREPAARLHARLVAVDAVRCVSRTDEADHLATAAGRGNQQMRARQEVLGQKLLLPRMQTDEVVGGIGHKRMPTSAFSRRRQARCR